jgi:hypothetical protein
MIQSRKGAGYWREQVALARSTRLPYERWWEENLKAYAPMASQDPTTYGTTVNTNRDFTLAERKKADLFFQKPEVNLQPTPLMDGPLMDPSGQPMLDAKGQPVPASVALEAHEEIVNELLGPDKVDAAALMDQVLLDCLNTSGSGATIMGLESATITQTVPDPITGIDREVPVPIYQHCFWEYVSPKAVLIAHTHRSTTYDKAPWMGHEFELPLTPGNRARFNLPDDFAGNQTNEALHFDHGATQATAKGDVFRGVQLWYRSALWRDDVAHPDHLTRLVLVDGVDEPVIEEDSPYQTLTPKGTLTPDSLIGFPIHLFTLRTLTDSAYVPSDSTMIRPLVNELNVFRTQMVQARDAMIARFKCNSDVLPKEAVIKMVGSPIGGMIMVPGEAMGEGVIEELPHGSYPRESFTSNDYIDNDIARTTAIDAAGAGVQSQGGSTATEQQIVAANANARLDKERGRILTQYLRAVTKFSTLVQRYLPVEQAAEIVGPVKAQWWDQWRPTVPSALAFTALPDSALRVDQAVDRKQFTEFYSFVANDPYTQAARPKLLEKLFRKHHVDPTGLIVPPPEKKPEPPKLSFSFKGEDLVGPQAVIVLGIAEQLGIKIDPAWVTISQQALASAQALEAEAAEAKGKPESDTQHGGKLAPQESLSKHAADQTGGMQNTGAPAALGAGGGYLQ